MQEKQKRVALITGSARRIGKNIAQTLHHQGVDVIIHYRQSQSPANDLVNALNVLRKNSAKAYHCDLTNIDSIKNFIKAVINWKGRLDVLINNASVFLPTDATDCSENNWDSLFTTNVKAPFYLSMQAFPHLAKHEGCIINITDIHAEKPLKGYSVYCQSKAALLMQTRSLAREFAPKVRVNAIAPGAIAWPEGINELSASIQQKIIEQTPLKRHGEPLFISQALLTLIDNLFITGQMLSVDGGRSLL